MIELINERICFRFPDIHPQAECHILFQRSFRLGEAGDPLLGPGRGGYWPDPIDEYTGHLPLAWQRHGGVLLPMYQSEALWLRFFGEYPCAIKVAVGSTNGLTGKGWHPPLARRPQDYLVTPDQPWLLGYFDEPGRLQQFVPAPLTAGRRNTQPPLDEAAVTMEVVVFPLKSEAYREWQEMESHHYFADADTCNCLGSACSLEKDQDRNPEGRMQLEIPGDDYGWENWDQSRAQGCFIYLLNSRQYQDITGREPAQTPLTEEDYMAANMTWNQTYAEAPLPDENLPAETVPNRPAGVKTRTARTPKASQARRRYGRVRQVREADG